MAFWVNMSAFLQRFFTRVVTQTRQKATGSLIFLHGSGDTGIGVKEWVDALYGKEFAFPHLRVLYPTAPPRPYTPMMGGLSTVWYDRKQISPSALDDESVEIMCKELSALVESEVKLGIPIERIIIGGFSMGGGMSLQLAYRFLRNIGGVFALSSFLSENSQVFETLKNNPTPAPKLFMCHGQKDELVQYTWGKSTFDKLQELNVPSEFHPYPYLTHEMSHTMIQQLEKWILSTVPVDIAQSNI